MHAVTVRNTRTSIMQSGRKPWNRGKWQAPMQAGEEVEYEQVPAALTFNGMNTALYAVGDTGEEPESCV